ncbi:MAG TPA: hypothetical protein VGN04_10435 [Herbaspirillum sp.]|jgi:hypothetical protein
MKLHEILAAELPDIDDSVKECVNMGEWLLFKTEVHKAGSEAAYYLKTSTGVFELSDRGEVLQEVAASGDSLEIDELFYFSDVRKPDSLSNMRV